MKGDAQLLLRVWRSTLGKHHIHCINGCWGSPSIDTLTLQFQEKVNEVTLLRLYTASHLQSQEKNLVPRADWGSLLGFQNYVRLPTLSI